VTATRVGAVLAALFASVAFPLLVRADPSQPAVAGFLLSAGSILTIVLDHTVSTAELEPGAIIPAHLRDAIVVRGKTLAKAGAPLHLIVTEVRRAGNGVGGEVVLRVEPVHLEDELNLPMRLLHPALSATLVLANPDDITLPAKEKTSPPVRGSDLTLVPGTLLRARTMATVDATDPNKTVLATPLPYTLSTDRPYAAFTPIPLTTYNPSAFTPAPRRRRGRPTPSPSPSPSPSETATATPTPNPTPS
jgi:hypothetical protein